jgi:hypothetical protein
MSGPTKEDHIWGLSAIITAFFAFFASQLPYYFGYSFDVMFLFGLFVAACCYVPIARIVRIKFFS